MGASVTVYWYAPTKGAFLDPSANDHSAGPYTTTGGPLSIPVDESNGVYMVQVVATGYATKRYFVWACGGHCNPVSGGKPELGAGYEFLGPSPSSYLTGVSIATNVQTSPLYTWASGGAGATFALWPNLTAVAAISGTTSTTSNGLPTATGGSFTLKTFTAANDGYVLTCQSSAATNPGYILVGCVGDGRGIQVSAVWQYMTCPWPGPEPSGDVSAAPTDLATFEGGRATNAQLDGVVTGIEYSPFKVSGTWNSSLVRAGRLGYGTAGGSGGIAPYVNFTAPDPSLIPLSGNFTIS